MKKDNKKRVKEKIEITLRILLLFIIVKNIGYSEENLQDIETGIEIKNKSNEVIDVSDINHGAYKEVNGLKIENSENLTVNIKEINTTLKKKRGGATGIIWGKGLENIGTKNEVYMSDGLKINVTTGELGGNTTTLVGVTNQGKLTLGENTKINVLINTKEVGSSSTAYGAELKYSSSTYFGKGSEINVSNSTGIAVGISVDSTGFSNKSNVFIGDDVKIRAEVREAKSEIKNGHWALGIYQLLGDTITIGNGLILETEITLSSGVSGQSYAVYNMANGKINIGNNAAISAKGTNASSVMGLNNNSGKMNIGKNSQISAEGTDASKVYTVCNDGLSSEVTIEDGGTITAIGENTGFVMGLYNSGKMNIGNGVKIISILNSEKEKDNVYGAYNTKGSKLDIGNGVKISSTINSKEQKNSAYSVYNIENSILNIGKNSQISAEGTDTRQISAVYNDGLSSEVTIKDGGTITAIGENIVFIMGLYNNNGGKMNIGNGVKIISILNSEKEKDNVYGVYNTKDSKLNIGDGVKIFSTINSKEQKNYAYSVYNKGDSILNIGKNSEISVEGKDANQIRAVHNDGSSSEVTIEDGGTITAIGENTGFVMGLYNNNGGKMDIGNGVKISSILNSKSQKNYAYSVYNKGDSILNIGKNSEISVAGKDTNQIRAVHNDGSSSEVTIEDGSIITAIGENTSFVIGVSNKTGSIKLNGGTSIYSDGYAVYNDNGNVSITDEGYNKKIQGLIFSTKAGSITDILLDTEDSYLEGRSVQENGGVFNLGLKNNAAWYIPQDSTVTNFNIENGIVDMAQNYKGETINGKQTLSIDNTTGEGGKYILDISPEDKDQTGNKTDYIYIKKADTSQKNYVQAGKTSISDLVNHNFSDKENSSIMIAASDKNVTFEGSEFSDISNIYNYTLSIEENVHGDGENNKENENNWYVTGISKKEGEVVEKVEEDLTLNYMNAALSRLELDTIHKRLGEIRDYTSENGVWVRIVSGKMEHDKSSGKFKNDYNMLQVGYDKRKETEKGSVFTGFAVHKRDGKADFRNGDGKNHNMGISMYKSFAYNDNSYTDIIFKYSYLDNDYKNYTENNQKLEADYNTWGGSLSLEHGKKYENNAWYVTPHVQMNYTYVKGADYSMNSGVRVEQRDIKSVIGRAGIYTGHDFNKSSHFIKVGVLHEFAGEYGAKITGEDASINKRYSGRDTWIEIGIGGQFRVGKTGTTHLYYDLEKTFGSDFETNWQASIGIRIRF
ncbi:putative autotransporter [Fusobacterium varium]|nr:putative autotransporter [Fusobacterium varium]